MGAPFNPSTYQSAIFKFIRTGNGCALVEAVAGSGKTTTIVEALKMIPAADKVLFLAFNKSIAAELKTRVPPHVDAMTLNALGHRAWTKFAGRLCQLDSNKTRGIIDTALAEDEKPNRAAITRLVAVAKSCGLVPNTAKDAAGLRADTLDEWSDLIDHFEIEVEEKDKLTVIESARRVLKLSLSRHDLIDFDDQLYMTVVFNAPLARYDWVFVDEAQDLSPIQHALLRKALKPGGRLVAVGDSKQAIYGFRGADSNSMDVLRQEFNCVRLPLSISYRCPRNVVDYAKHIVPHIEASDTAPDGTVMSMPQYSETDFAPDDMIICRNTRPIISLAYKLIARMVPVKVLGREIGQGLISLIERLRPQGIDGEKGLVVKLDRWTAKEIERCMARGQEQKAEAAMDKADTIRTFIEFTQPETVAQLTAAIHSLFTDDGRPATTLSTIHRAKGLEAPRVFVLDPDLMPSRYARQEWQMEQEKNLMYVAYTRAKGQLIFIRSDAMKASATMGALNNGAAA